MVATRRQVQKKPEEDLAQDATMRKKPVRKATAKAATTAKTTSNAETKTRSTRGKKTELETNVQEMNVTEEASMVQVLVGRRRVVPDKRKKTKLK